MKSLTLICYATFVLTAFSSEATTWPALRKSGDGNYVYFMESSESGCWYGIAAYKIVFAANTQKHLKFFRGDNVITYMLQIFPDNEITTLAPDNTNFEDCGIKPSTNDGICFHTVTIKPPPSNDVDRRLIV